MSRAALLKIERARWWALSEQAFYGSLAMRLTDVLDDSVQTAETDGRVIKWNPEWVAALDDETVRFVLLHETMHCAHLHMWRLPADEHGNKAGDYAINLTLRAIKGAKMPEGALCDERFDNMAEEDIYAALQPPPTPPSDAGNDDEQGDDEQQDEQQDGSGDEQGDDSSDGDGEDDAEGDGDAQGEAHGEGAADSDADSDASGTGSGSAKSDPCGSFSKPAAQSVTPAEAQQQRDDLRDQWERAVMQAAQVAQATQGTLPADLARELERRRAQRIDWRRECSDFVRDMVSSRNDWSRASRRHAWQRVIYPKRHQDDIGVIVAARDTSGSISPQVLAQFTALIEACAAETNARVLMIDCDAQVQSEHWIERGESVPDAIAQNAKGGGGTDFRPVFDRVRVLEDEGERVAGVVYATDLYGTEPEQNDHATLWLCTTPDRIAASGRTVFIDPAFIN